MVWIGKREYGLPRKSAAPGGRSRPDTSTSSASRLDRATVRCRALSDMVLRGGIVRAIGRHAVACGSVAAQPRGDAGVDTDVHTGHCRCQKGDMAPLLRQYSLALFVLSRPAATRPPIIAPQPTP